MITQKTRIVLLSIILIGARSYSMENNNISGTLESSEKFDFEIKIKVQLISDHKNYKSINEIIQEEDKSNLNTALVMVCTEDENLERESLIKLIAHMKKTTITKNLHKIGRVNAQPCKEFTKCYIGGEDEEINQKSKWSNQYLKDHKGIPDETYVKEMLNVQSSEIKNVQIISMNIEE